LAVVLFRLLLQGFGLALIAHRLGLVLPSEEAEPT
jgi:CPA1 family monovalent cation:H+ antiporter/cell volume regulation protein A